MKRLALFLMMTVVGRGTLTRSRRCRTSHSTLRRTPLQMPPDIHLGEVAGVATNSKGNSSSTREPAIRPPASATRACSPTADRGSSSSIATATSSRKSARASMDFCSRTACGSTRRTTSGSSTRARARSSIRSRRTRADDARPQARGCVSSRSDGLGAGPCDRRRAGPRRGGAWRWRRRRPIHPSERRRLGRRRQHLRRRRPRTERTHREVRQERPIPPLVGIERIRRRAVRHAAFARHRRPGQRLRCGPGQQAHSGVRWQRSRSSHKSRTSASRRPSASREAPIPIFTARTLAMPTEWTMRPIYKLELDGRIVGKFGKAGKQAKEFGLVNSIDCRGENTLLVGELTNWRVQKLVLHPQ